MGYFKDLTGMVFFSMVCSEMDFKLTFRNWDVFVILFTGEITEKLVNTLYIP